MYRFIICAGMMALAAPALAVNGAVVPDATQIYNINLDKADIVNKPGKETKPFTWALGTTYGGRVYCPDQYIPESPIYYRAVISDGLPPVGGGFVKLNEFLDMKVEIYIAGNRRALVTAPFNNESNLGRYGPCYKGNSVGFQFESGSHGQVTFRVRKPIINGVHISDHQIVEMFGRLGMTDSNFSGDVMSRIVIQSSILYVPEECVINGGQTIEVEFGDLPGNGLDGNNFEKVLPLTFQCKGGAFEGNALKINLGISGRPTYFNQEYLRTTKDGYQGGTVIPDLGIKFKQLDGSPLRLNEFYPVSMQGNIGDWGFIAAPITPVGADIPAGDFYATATIVAEFQ
ncbi:fimbrial protein [Aeromonas hydrophila]|uniref:fimbrial protein n=1 Tax=Aeromonas hydrophila TaxID=644 RepID=UPI000444DDE8|nr:fimbrial protein [Aeromonas hydrophila]AHX31047.1 fimbrial protein [Aeromonas hydrophila subsp. hydrophila AL09-71]AHX67842.1 fimbrial protein [Aeromonas hydrophila pc104A]AJE38105.1 fimbrial protein [Aeromonas hydrophila J-1]AKJ36404.1 fimbrial protein [Aeromonas hydrophila NJ-35]ALQ65195.1 fimbrial protein [Aeromonas hydrophila]